MSLFREIEQIKAQITDTRRMLDLVGNHAFMRESLNSKLVELTSQLQAIPNEIFEPKISLLFSGGAVKGSMGIKSSFISKTLSPFQEMIKTQAAIVRFGHVARRGQARRGPNADLYVTALPTGSFGVELSQLETNDLFAEQDVAKAMKQVVQLVVDSAESDKAFEDSIQATPKRNLTSLKRFLKEISDEQSILRMETGDTGIEISKEKIIEAYNRVASTVDEETETFTKATLRGILLDSGRFEAQSETGSAISGFISQDITEDQLIEYDKTYLNKICVIHLRAHKTSFKTGNEKIDYELLEIMNENFI